MTLLSTRGSTGHPSSTGDNVPVLGKVYDLILWYSPVIARFRRDARYSIGERLQDALLDAHGRLTDAAYGREREGSLAASARCIDRARLLNRLAHDLGLLDHRRYLFAAENLVEIGRMVGGWRKAESGRARRAAT